MMEIRFSKYIPAAAIAAAMLTGCSLQTNPETVPVTSSDAKVRLSFYGNEDETVITDICRNAAAGAHKLLQQIVQISRCHTRFYKRRTIQCRRSFCLC